MSFRQRLLVAGFCTCASLQSAPPPTFTGQVAKILHQNCAPCHHEGGPGPFPLLTYEEAKKRSRQIAAVTQARYMPPWLPDRQTPPMQDERHLTDAQIRTLAAWASAGAPEGDRAQMPAIPSFRQGWQLGQPDLILQAAAGHRIPADGPDVFWNFVLSPHLNHPRFVKAIEIRPQHPRLAHHANAILDRSQSGRTRGESPGSGFAGMDISVENENFDPDSHFLFWKPGSLPYVEPKGMAWQLRPGDDIILNMHLQPSGKEEEERPQVGLYFTDDEQTRFPILLNLERDGELHIPANQSTFVLEDQFRMPVDVDALAIYPHAHLLGKRMEAWALLPGGERRMLIEIPDWNLSWQAVYRYREPIFLPRGTVVHMRYTYDNSEANPRNPHHPPRSVEGGNQASDEMCHLWLQVLPRGGREAELQARETLFEAEMQNRLEKYRGDFLASFNLGVLALKREQAQAAEGLLTTAVGQRPDHPAALNALGAAYESAGEAARAESLFERALQVRPSYTDARYNLANVLADQGRFDQAIPLFREVLKEKPDDEGARQHLAVALKLWGDALSAQGQKAEGAERHREAAAVQVGKP